ncbi:S-layer homology domain-containing protein [Bacilliculturomica massiliensis]|uniref:S-layer homology domain-containing protein n=1 Tax=Bacilliculturomica massiliensis TaxID=1917867 RepID=UPI001031E38E|nr:S-layer homology domain-containing protein [Bacilliculturomica massiliensis]
MRQTGRVVLCSLISAVVFFTGVVCAVAETPFIGVVPGTDTGIREISQLTIIGDGLDGLCLAAEGTTEDTDTVVHMVLIGTSGEETTCTMPTVGNRTSELLCYPGIGLSFKDGYYMAAFIDTYHSVKVSETVEKGYRIYFEIKDNVVQPGWKDKTETAGNHEEGSDPPQTVITSGGVTVGPECSDMKGHWAEQEIRALLEKGIVTGYQDGTFRPDSRVTRAEFSQIIHQAFAINAGAEKGKFIDVKTGDWYYAAVMSLCNAGIVSGTDAGHFSPDDDITREQMAFILKGTAENIKLDLAIKRNYKPFRDDSAVSDYAKEAVRTMYQAGIVNGVADEAADGYRYLPKEGATRAEVATIVMKLLNQSE